MHSKRMPTWLEWERAARHTDQRRYPWGDQPSDVERANYGYTSIGRPSPIGCLPVGMALCGAQDLAGNVLEWTATPYQQPQHAIPQKDFTDSSGLVTSWSCYAFGIERLCCGARNTDLPYDGDGILGFRVMLSRALIV